MTKAKERMGYEPKEDFKGTLERAVKWEMKKREELLKFEKKKA